MKKMIIASLMLSSTVSFSMLRRASQKLAPTTQKLTPEIFNIKQINTRKSPFFQNTFQEQAASASKILIATCVFDHPEIMKSIEKACKRQAMIQLILGHMDHGCFETQMDCYKKELKELNIHFKEFLHWNPRDQGGDCYFKTDKEETLLSSSSNISSFGLNNDATCRFTNDPKLIAEFLKKFDRSWNNEEKETSDNKSIIYQNFYEQ